jgi:hypothetical protein
MSRQLHWLPAIVAAATTVLIGTVAKADTPGCTAKGALPAAFPAKLLMGIGTQQSSDTQALLTGQKYDVQWVYLSGQSGNNWYNGFTSAPADGSWIDGFFSDIAGHGLIPGIHYYDLGFGHDGGDSGLLTEIQSATWTKSYFSEFKVLMQKAKNFGKPVIIVLEGDSFGFLENLTNNDPTAMAAVASTGLPELASLPNTIAGFGMALLALRKSVGAYNVALGPDVPYYASQGDIMNYQFDALQPHIDYQWKFFGPFGVGANVTGDRFDFMSSAPDDADCASYTNGRPCWDPSDTAPTTGVASINRYISWLSLFNQTSGVRWMLHQVPLGNSQHRNVAYDGTAKSGYQDNRAEYLLQYESPASTAIRDQHLANFANAGVMGILFGFSNDGDTAWTDIWKDNQPFLVTHVAAVGNGSGFPIARGGAAGCSADGGVSSGSSSTATGGTSGGSGTASGSGSTGSANGTHTTASGQGSTNGSSRGSAGTTGASSGSGTGGSGGCSLTAPASPAGFAGGAPLALLGLAGLLRRRKS